MRNGELVTNVRYSTRVLNELPTIPWSESALFLDVDGTLVEIGEHPEAVRADDAVIALLRNAQRALDGALALVSGRPASDVDRVFSAARFVIVGSHGAEIRWVDGAPTNEPAATFPPALTVQAERFADEHDGLLIEQKMYGFALHFRQAPHLDECCRRFMNELLDEAGDAYRLLDGKMVLEVLPRRFNKGTGVGRVLEKPPFRGRTPVYVGDDVTDEDGFRIVNERSGVSIRVGQAAQTAARFALDSVPAVHDWLQEVAGQGVNG